MRITRGRPPYAVVRTRKLVTNQVPSHRQVQKFLETNHKFLQHYTKNRPLDEEETDEFYGHNR